MSDTAMLQVLRDWRVLVMIVLIIASIGSIYLFPFSPENGMTGNLQLGLDLEGGAWLQLGFKAEVVGYTTDRSVDEFVADLRERLDAEIYAVDDERLEIRKYYTRDELETVFAAAGGRVTSYVQGVSEATADDVKRILEEKVNTLGTRDARINTLTGMEGVSRYIRIEIAGEDINTAQDIVGKQGKFEIRIQTAGNETEHVLFGEDITSVSTPSQYPPGSGQWGVGFTLSDTGADAFRNAAITYGAVTSPESHELVMLLDGAVVYSAPLSADLAASLQTMPVRQLSASTGGGTEGLEQAKALEIHLRAGALPVDVEVAGSGSVPANLGEYFKSMSLYAGIIALLAVGVTVYYRYREPSIVLPMIGTNIAEIIILLGIARFIQQLDLASIAGLIAVLGTGIDQLVVITDEVLHEGRVPSPNLYLK
ncbi:MAG: preprotein translocase subunit SecD, partial [Methanomicrobiales archaeon]|nr:preprotein translocase subunit SecD [Methanomicrobiales archaeon]